jgi:hypothetical protein
VTTDGVVLGARELDRPDWPAGSVIYTGPDEPNLRVVDVLATEDDDDPGAVQGARRRGGLRCFAAGRP